MSKLGILKSLFRDFTFFGFLLVCMGLTAALVTFVFLNYMVKGEIVATPNLYGKDIEAIQVELDRLGLILNIDSKRVPSNVVSIDCAVFQTPGPGRKIKKERIIEVSLSSGPEIKLVPDLKNQSIYFAKLMAKKLDSKISKPSVIPSSAYKKGRVIGQTPKTGSEIPSRTGISVLLSDGPSKSWYVMPDVQGSPFSTAKTFFEENGFRIVSKYKYNARMLPDEIIMQRPIPGYPVQENSTITLEVNRVK